MTKSYFKQWVIYEHNFKLKSSPLCSLYRFHTGSSNGGSAIYYLYIFKFGQIYQAKECFQT